MDLRGGAYRGTREDTWENLEGRKGERSDGNAF